MAFYPSGMPQIDFGLEFSDGNVAFGALLVVSGHCATLVEISLNCGACITQ